MSRTRVTSVNLNNKAHSVTARQQSERLDQLAEVSDVLVTQEAVRGITVPDGFRPLPNLGGGGTQEVLIAVRESLRITGHGYMRAHRGVSHKWPARWFPWVTLGGGGDDLRDPDLTVIGLHLNSGIDAGGHWRVSGDDPRRFLTESYIDSVIDLGRLVRNRLSDSVLVIGDTNVDAYDDQRIREARMPAARFGRYHFTEALPKSKSGTLGSRRVDRVFHSLDLSVSVVDRARPAWGEGVHQAITATAVRK